MNMQLSNEPQYIGEYGNAACSTWDLIAGKLKRIWDLMIAFSPILWVIFFLILTVLVNSLTG